MEFIESKGTNSSLYIGWNQKNRKAKTDRPPNKKQLKIVPTKQEGHKNTPKKSAKQNLGTKTVEKTSCHTANTST